jgi:RimJ/RimL family protein N-acetyltransferase
MDNGVSLFPRPKEIYRHPTFGDAAKAELVGKIFYELHPQLWGQGLMSEAFTEVLRFAFEEVGCIKVEVCLSS